MKLPASNALPVSVVIATFNRAAMVAEAVTAAWTQTLRPAEIVVSDDASTDGTLATLRALQGQVPALRIVENAVNSGGVPNWNAAVNAATGVLIAWCSDDDLHRPEHLEQCVRYLADHPEVDMVHAGFTDVRQDADGVYRTLATNLKSSRPIAVTRDNAVAYMTAQYMWPFHPSTLVFRRRLWERTGGFDPQYAVADTDWFLRAAMHHRIVYLPHVGAVNRRHAGASGNWSLKVGSVGMQREFRRMMLAFADAARTATPPVPRLEAQLAAWMRRYRLLLLRLYVSRARAGRSDSAMEAITELTLVTPPLHAVPGLHALARRASPALRRIQMMLPSGEQKYRSLGVHIPD